MARKIQIEHKHKNVVAPKPHHVDPSLRKYQKNSMQNVTGRTPRRGKGSLIGLWVGIGSVMLFVLALGFFMLNRQSNLERIEKAAMNDVRERANKACESVEAAIAHMQDSVAPARELHTQAEAALAVYMEEEPVKPTRQSAWAPPPAEAAAPAAAPRPATPRPAGTTRPAASTPSDEDREPVAGILPLAEVIRRRQMIEQGLDPDAPAERPKPKADRPAPVAQAAPAAPSAAYAQRSAQRMEPEIVSLTRHLKLGAEWIERRADEIRVTESTALRIRGTILSETVLVKARKQYDSLVECLTIVQAASKEVDEKLEEMRGQLATVKRIEADTLREREERHAKEDRERKEREHRERVATEQKMAAQLRVENAALIAKNAFSQALNATRDQAANYRTDEGRALVQTMIDRYTRLVQLKDFLIDRLQRDAISFGWIQDGQPKDIDSADRDGVVVKGQTVPWHEVTTVQILKLIKYYCASEKVKRSIRGEAYLGAAILFVEIGKPEVVDEFREEALTLAPELTADVRRLLAN